MKRLAVFIFIFWLSSANAFAQETVFNGILRRSSCGEFLAWMDGIVSMSEKYPDSKIYLVYYGERFRKTYLKKKGGDVIMLEYAHRDDGLNWAKAIPFYMSPAKVGQDE